MLPIPRHAATCIIQSYAYIFCGSSYTLTHGIKRNIFLSITYKFQHIINAFWNLLIYGFYIFHNLLKSKIFEYDFVKFFHFVSFLLITFWWQQLLSINWPTTYMYQISKRTLNKVHPEMIITMFINYNCLALLTTLICDKQVVLIFQLHHTCCQQKPLTCTI